MTLELTVVVLPFGPIRPQNYYPILRILASFHFFGANISSVVSSHSTAIHSWMPVPRSPLLRNTWERSPEVFPMAPATLPRSIPQCRALEIQATMRLRMCSVDPVIVDSLERQICPVALGSFYSTASPPPAFFAEGILSRPSIRQINKAREPSFRPNFMRSKYSGYSR